MAQTSPQDILDFWFAESRQPKWFVKDSLFDQEIINQFLDTYKVAKENQGLNCDDTPENNLAQVILFDQFPRNMFRDTPDAFATDALARSISKKVIEQGGDMDLSPPQRSFLYMPFMHSEDLEEQRYSVSIYEKLAIQGNLDYAIMHLKVIEEFGRFPHRNKILSRESTEAEKEYLAKPGAGF